MNMRRINIAKVFLVIYCRSISNVLLVFFLNNFLLHLNSSHYLTVKIFYFISIWRYLTTKGQILIKDVVIAHVIYIQTCNISSSEGLANCFAVVWNYSSFLLDLVYEKSLIGWINRWLTFLVMLELLKRVDSVWILCVAI